MIETPFPRFDAPLGSRADDVARQLAAHAAMDGPARHALLQRQLASLLGHARAASPFWARRLARFEASLRSGRTVRLSDLPILTRRDLQRAGASMRARSAEIAPRDLLAARTSGSTGRPVEVLRYLPFYAPVHVAIAMLEHRWHQRDTGSTLAVIKDAPDAEQRGWGWGAERTEGAGLRAVRNLIEHSPEALLAWLDEIAPRYLSTTPTMALRLAQLALSRPGGVLRIEQVVTFGELVTDQLRETVRAAFGAKVVDVYSCEELGWIALQCPRHEHLHVMSASVLLEIVDGSGRPCPAGRPGRVLLTGLHSHAMPLIRYEIGDHAQWGAPCDCGIRLPVLARIWGRERSFLRMPDGSYRIARLTGEHWRRVAPVGEYKVVQYADGQIEAFVTAPRRLEAVELERLAAMLTQVLGEGLRVIVTQTDRIDWDARWKRTDVIRLNRLRGGS
ncbi:MAG: AMP-binding protein [Burkholderiales bacterium]|nr:MAG: AMP-binding protein [Burkholderiales bacterium]